MWALDFQHDQTADGRALRILNIVDEYTREALAMHVARSITADDVVTVLERLGAKRGAPAYLRCDNGTELTAHALMDWCRFTKASTSYIDPGSPWQNAFVESFNGRVRDELLERRGVLLPGRSPRRDRRLARGLQHPATTLRAGDAHPSRVRRRLHGRPGGRRLTPAVARGRKLAARLALRARLRGELPSGQPPSVLALHPPGSHNRWTEERGPVSSMTGSSLEH